MILTKYLGFLFSSKTITMRANTPYDIDYGKLKQNGVMALIFDYDDTLAEFNGSFSPQAHDLLKKLNKNFKIAIVSNCCNSRKDELTREYPYVYVHLASFKPAQEGYFEVLNRISVQAGKTAMIGDRPAIDLYGAYLAGIKERILVKPYSEVFGGKKPFLLYQWLRKIETKKCLI